uniref:Uncharacterized protein n=1 Tax=Leersia perrieri TaxID=77586 RepID=A0A0D9WQR2_9ORYZ
MATVPRGYIVIHEGAAFQLIQITKKTAPPQPLLAGAAGRRTLLPALSPDAVAVPAAFFRSHPYSPEPPALSQTSLRRRQLRLHPIQVS